MQFKNINWPDIASFQKRIFVVPLGSMEQHGHHLPLFTDSMIISQIADQVEKQCSERIALLPTQWLGHSPHHRRFGCVSLDLLPYIQMICGLCRSLIAMGARKIFLLNGHGGNDIPCKAALRELKSEFESLPDLYIAYATYWNLAAEEFTRIRDSPTGGMGHACEMETSILLKTHPELVKMDRAKRGGPTEESGFRVLDMLKTPPFFLMNEFDELSETGVMGMPEFATAEKGELFLDAAVKAVSRFIEEFDSWHFQTQR